MKIKLLIYAVWALAMVIALGSCRNDITDPLPTEEVPLTLLPSLAGANEEVVVMRATGDSFFENNDQITVMIKTSRAGATSQPFGYVYNNGTFTGGFKFSPDNTYITELEALWPAKGSPGREEIITDQREYDHYKQANRLKATANTKNIMPTVAPVPLVFKQEQSKLTFRLAGQNANGLIIKALLLELEADLDGDGTKKKTAFWAYCEGDNGTLNAGLILPTGTVIGPNYSTSTERFVIGLVTVGEAGNSNKDYRGMIYLPESTDITLQENHEYLVTLTPEGYDMLAVVSISTFPQAEGYVAIPFQLPVYNNGAEIYEINTVAQLVTISWLLGCDLNGELQNDWVDRLFDIPEPIVVSDKVKAEGDSYLNVSNLKAYKDQFSNTDNATYADGTKVFD